MMEISEVTSQVKDELVTSTSTALTRMLNINTIVVDNIKQHTAPKLSNFIDVYITLDNVRKSDRSNPSEGKYTFDLLHRFTNDNGIGIHVSDTLEGVIEVQFGEINIPDYGEYTYYLTTTDPPLVANAAAPPAFTRTPYGIIVIEYYELVHLLSDITTSIGNHFLFRAVVEGNRMRLIPIFDRVTFKSPQIIDKSISLTFSDQITRLGMLEDTYKNVYICMCQHDNGSPPYPNGMYLGIMVNRSELLADDRVLIQGFNSFSLTLNSYVSNRGGLYISADYRTAANRSDIVFTNPAIRVDNVLDIGITATRESISNIDNAVYNNAIDGVNATLTVINPSTTSYFDQNIAIGDRVLVKEQTDQTTNGVYDVVTLLPLVLRRVNMNVRYGTIITVNTITNKWYYISQNINEYSVILGKSKIVFKPVPFDTQIYTNIVGILSYPCTVKVINRSFYIPMRFRKVVENTTNNIIIT